MPFRAPHSNRRLLYSRKEVSGSAALALRPSLDPQPADFQTRTAYSPLPH